MTSASESGLSTQAVLHAQRNDCQQISAHPRERNDACKARAIRDARLSAFWRTWWNWQERFDKIAQRIWKQRGGYMRSRYLADENRASEVLLHALKKHLWFLPILRDLRVLRGSQSFFVSFVASQASVCFVALVL